MLHDAAAPLSLAVPWREGRLTVLAVDDEHAITSWEHVDARGSNAGRVLDHLLGVRTTARGAGTIIRLAARV